MFEVGDVVQLKSGGPHMTVSNIPSFPDHKIHIVECMWFSEVGKVYIEQFGPSVIFKVPAQSR